MGHTNSTTNYNLPQFVTTDKPAWLTDVNNAYADIDAAIHTAQTDATTAGNNATQALSDAADASTAASAADAKGAGAVASIEAAFDSTAVYAVGAKVMYNSLLYVCTVAVTTPGPWTGSANWSRTTVDDLIPESASQLPLVVGGNIMTNTAIDSKWDKPTEYTTTTNALTIKFNAIGSSCMVIINRGFNAYDACFILLTGTNNNNAQVIELYKGSSFNAPYKATDGLGFTLSSAEMDSSSISIIPIKGFITEISG